MGNLRVVLTVVACIEKCVGCCSRCQGHHVPVAGRPQRRGGFPEAHLSTLSVQGRHVRPLHVPFPLLPHRLGVGQVGPVGLRRPQRQVGRAFNCALGCALGLGSPLAVGCCRCGCGCRCRCRCVSRYRCVRCCRRRYRCRWGEQLRGLVRSLRSVPYLCLGINGRVNGRHGICKRRQCRRRSRRLYRPWWVPVVKVLHLWPQVP